MKVKIGKFREVRPGDMVLFPEVTYVMVRGGEAERFRVCNAGAWRESYFERGSINRVAESLIRLGYVVLHARGVRGHDIPSTERKLRRTLDAHLVARRFVGKAVDKL